MVEPKKLATPPAGLPGPLVGMLARVKGLVWEVTLVSDPARAWVNLRSVDGGETRAACYQANGAYFMDADEVIFDDRQSTGTQLLAIVKGEGDVRPALSRQSPVGAGLALDDPPYLEERCEDA